jgi:hypothetical protein
MPYAPTVTDLLDEAPAPRTSVLFSSLHPDTESLRAIHRLGGGRDFRVRDSINIAVSDQAQRLDHEAPFGIPLTYRAEMLNGAGDSLGFTDASAPVTLDVEDTWVHNPLDPTTAVKVGVLDRSDHEWRRPVPGEKFYPEGRRVAVVVSGARRGVQNVTLSVMVETLDDADRFANLVGDYNSVTTPVLCFRLGAGIKMRLPRPLFTDVLDLKERSIDLHIAGGTRTEFVTTGDEAAPPTPALVIPLLTRADLNAYYATRSALNADNLTRLGVNTRYDLAGTA